MKTSFYKCLLTAGMLNATVAVAQIDDTGGALILEHANQNENIYSSATGAFISYLRGDVAFKFEDVRITSDEATWLKNDGIIDFKSNISVEQRGQLMNCDLLRFVKDKNLLTASGNVLYQDSARVTAIRGKAAEYMTNKREATLTGDPLLTRLDSAEVDTVFISGRIMRYSDSLKTAVVTSNVSISKGNLNAVGQKCEYFANDDIARLRVNPVIRYEKHIVVGDSVDLFLNEKSIESARVIGSARGHYVEIADSSKDTVISNIWSDSLRLTMFESGKINMIKAFGNACGAYFESAAAPGTATTTHVSSDSMYMSMFENSKVNSMKAFGGARGNHSEIFTSGRATAIDISSDSMHVFMHETGKLQTMKAFGGARGRSAEISAKNDTLPSQDSAITRIAGDSLRLSATETGKIKTMKAFGNVKSESFILGDSARASEISGNTMTLTFDGDGKIERAVVVGNAVSKYYLEDSDGGGRNDASGEAISVTFTAGKAKRLRAKGNVKGTYAP